MLCCRGVGLPPTTKGRSSTLTTPIVVLYCKNSVRMETADAAAASGVTSATLDHSRAVTVTSSNLQLLASAAEHV